MEATMILADFVEALNGKLYIMGGGWTAWRGSEPVACGVGLVLAVPWTDTNVKHALCIELVHEDGGAVGDLEGNPIRIDSEFEVGRPPGHVAGDPITSALAFRFGGLPLPSGGYQFSFSVDGTQLARAQFRVHRPEDG
jgi:uncharacterized protein DUF6941